MLCDHKRQILLQTIDTTLVIPEAVKTYFCVHVQVETAPFVPQVINAGHLSCVTCLLFRAFL